MKARITWCCVGALTLWGASAVAKPKAAPTITLQPVSSNDPGLVPTFAVNAAQQPPALTADTMATADRPAGFTYSIVRDALVDDLTETLLYVKANKEAKTTTAVPVPKDRTRLGACIAGGKVEDLVRGTVVTVEFDPKGVVKPQIVIQTVSQLEVLDGAKVMDRGGNKLFVLTADGKNRGFAIEGGQAAWDSVVEGGKSLDLKPGTPVRITFDPSGRQPLKVKLLGPPAAAAPPKSRGCTASPRPGQALPMFAALGLAWLLLRRRPAGR